MLSTRNCAASSRQSSSFVISSPLGRNPLLGPSSPSDTIWASRLVGGGTASDWRRAVAAVSERRVAEGRALYTQRSPAELYRGARSSERERYARPRGPRKFALANFWGEPASRLGAERPSPSSGRAYHHRVSAVWPTQKEIGKAIRLPRHHRVSALPRSRAPPRAG